MTYGVSNQNSINQVRQMQANRVDGVTGGENADRVEDKSLVMREKEVRNLSYVPSTPELESAGHEDWDRQGKYESVMSKLFAARLSIGGNSMLCDMYFIAQFMLRTAQIIRNEERKGRSALNQAIQENFLASASIQRSAAFRGALVGGIVCGMQAVGMVVSAGVQSKGLSQNEQVNEFGGVDMAKEQMGMTEVLGDENAATVQLNTTEKAASRVLGAEGVQEHQMANVEKLDTARSEFKAAQRDFSGQSRMAAEGEVNNCQNALNKEYNTAVQEESEAAGKLQSARDKVPPNQQEIEQAEVAHGAAQEKLEYFRAKKQFAAEGGAEGAKAKAADAVEKAGAKVAEIENAKVGEGETFANQADKEAALQSAIDEHGKAVDAKLEVDRRANLVQEVEGEPGRPYGKTGRELGEKLDLAKQTLAEMDAKYTDAVKKYNKAFGIESKDNPENVTGGERPDLEKAARHAAALDDVENFKKEYETARNEYVQTMEGEKTGARDVTKDTVKTAETNYRKAEANYKLARAKQVKISTDLKLNKETYVATRESAVMGYREAAKSVEGSLVSNDANKLMTAGMLAQQIWNVMGQEGQQIVQAYKETMLAETTELSGEERILEDEKDQIKDQFDAFERSIDAAISLLKGVYTTDSSSIDAIIRS